MPNKQTAAAKCTFVKPDGTSCKANALPGSSYCYFHDPDRAGERQQARKKGGRTRSKPAAILPAPTLTRPIKDGKAIVKLLSETIGHVQTGAIEVKAANAIAGLASVLLRAIETSDVMRRIEALESDRKKR